MFIRTVPWWEKQRYCHLYCCLHSWLLPYFDVQRTVGRLNNTSLAHCFYRAPVRGTHRFVVLCLHRRIFRMMMITVWNLGLSHRHLGTLYRGIYPDMNALSEKFREDPYWIQPRERCSGLLVRKQFQCCVLHNNNNLTYYYNKGVTVCQLCNAVIKAWHLAQKRYFKCIVG